MMGEGGGGGHALQFVTETELEKVRQVRGERPEDGTVPADRPLYEILKENKEKKDAEFKEKFRNLPPKALDDEETEFLEAVEKQRRDIEKSQADEEARELTNFQAAILERTLPASEVSMPRAMSEKDDKSIKSRRTSVRPVASHIQVKHALKKHKPNVKVAGAQPQSALVSSAPGAHARVPASASVEPLVVADNAATIISSLVSYASDGEDDDDR
eukprot:SM000275S10316  [mRNA]  locus=s275:12296:14297:+ [translate_table: standard]